MGSQNCTRGPCATWTPLAENIYTEIEYFTISNCVFNFNFLPLVLSEILGDPKCTLSGPVPPVRPLAEIFFCTQGKYFTISNSIFNFNFLALVISEILGGSKFTLGAYAPWTPLAEKFLYAKRVLHNI